MKESNVVKYYNPYPFLVRVLNDLGQPQVLAPQAHGKVQGGKYIQSKLELLPIKGHKVFKTNLGIDLKRLTKEELIAVAWAVLAIEPEIEDTEKMSKKDLSERISKKVTVVPKRIDIDETLVEESEEEEEEEEEEVIDLNDEVKEPEPVGELEEE